MPFVGLGKYIIYIDESNCNMFLRRSFGRLKKGVRCCVTVYLLQNEKNVHVIVGISQSGLIYWERRRGSYRKDDCCQWLRCLLRQVHEPMSDVVIVCENAPVHMCEVGTLQCTLNLIEECWSVVKSVIKKQLLLHFQIYSAHRLYRNNTN